MHFRFDCAVAARLNAPVEKRGIAVNAYQLSSLLTNFLGLGIDFELAELNGSDQSASEMGMFERIVKCRAEDALADAKLALIVEPLHK
ncbi:hypothetical protein CPY51_06010 [Rhizobium tubonense]|uniref:Uncharacterized protein n=1 Tax=Rhizobium tubonense TaxID=484088 RepID=A0A2W4CW78_9HYPH|nr:hypothetical protein CPY51_06010 [Rhizobium tubonense]